MEKFLTIGTIAESVNRPRSKVHYVLNQIKKPHLGWAGKAKVYDAGTVEAVALELSRIESKHKAAKTKR